VLPELTALRRLEVLTLVAIVALAAWLRLNHLDLIEYKADEAIAVELTLPLIEGREVPRAGLVSSVGMRNPPMLMYLLAAPLFVDAEPMTASGFVAILSTMAVVSTYLVMRQRFGPFVALTASALFATAPWAVLFGRKIWAQDLLPLFSVALLHCLFAIVERPRTRLVLWVPVLVCALWQLHFSAFAVLPIAGVVVLYAARRLHGTALALGVALAATMLVPYLLHQVGEGWNDIRILRSLAARPGDRKPPLDARPVLFTADISGADGWAFVTGDSDRAFTARARSARRAADVASTFSRVFLLGGVAMLLAGLLWRASRRGPTWRVLHVEDERHAVLLLWVGGIWATFIVARLDALYPHYFVLTYPAPFVIVALALDRCRGLAARWRPRPALAGAIIAVVAMCAAYSTFSFAFFRFVDRQGGTRGDYGVAYKHKNDIATFALRHSLELKEAPPEVGQLVALRRRYPRPDGRPAEVVPPGRSLEIRDWTRQGDFPECAAERRRQFGPLVACIRP
jgi:hypothetical protein